MQLSIVNLLNYWLVVIRGELALLADRLQRVENPVLPHKLLLWNGFYSAELTPLKIAHRVRPSWLLVLAPRLSERIISDYVILTISSIDIDRKIIFLCCECIVFSKRSFFRSLSSWFSETTSLSLLSAVVSALLRLRFLNISIDHTLAPKLT